jgi:hypothetical protein
MASALPRSASAFLAALVPALVLSVLAPATVTAQLERAQPRPEASETRQYDGLAEGPYSSLLIRNVMVLPGHGGPGQGPFDITVTGNVIETVRSHDPDRVVEADRVIEGGDGIYVMPGLMNLHLHLREEELPLDYIFYMQLATGVTSVGPAEEGRVRDILEAVRDNEILAPRLFPLYGWGSFTDYTPEQLQDTTLAPEIAREMIANGVRQVYINNLTWNPDLFGAAARAIEAAGGVTAVHIQPSNTSVVNAMDAGRLGVSMIVHHYGYAESALPRGVQDFPANYRYQDENIRFREAARVWHEVGTNPDSRHFLLNTLVDSLVHFGVVMQPNRATYEANRNILAAQGWPWHEKYTHQALWEWHLPNPDNHASFQYDWTSMDEFYWTYMYDLWAKMIFEFNKRGGTVVYGTDDNYQWSTGGFGNIRELQLVLESGMHPLEVLKTAQLNSAKFIMEPNLGMVQPGYVADLVVVDGNPAWDFKTLYPFGTIRMDPDTREMYRTRGILHTIKDGIVIENDRLMAEVERIVAESKRGVGPDVVTEPFVAETRRPAGQGGGGNR